MKHLKRAFPVALFIVGFVFPAIDYRLSMDEAEALYEPPRCDCRCVERVLGEYIVNHDLIALPTTCEAAPEGHPCSVSNLLHEGQSHFEGVIESCAVPSN